MVREKKKTTKKTGLSWGFEKDKRWMEDSKRTRITGGEKHGDRRRWTRGEKKVGNTHLGKSRTVVG